MPVLSRRRDTSMHEDPDVETGKLVSLKKSARAVKKTVTPVVVFVTRLAHLWDVATDIYLCYSLRDTFFEFYATLTFIVAPYLGQY